MEIRVDEDNRVLLAPFETSDYAEPSLAVHVELAGNGFTGRAREVWFWLARLRDFVDALEGLERDRSGEAILTSMGPNEFLIDHPHRRPSWPCRPWGDLTMAGVRRLATRGTIRS